MLVNTKARIGVFSIALGAYLPQFPSLVPEFEAQYADFKKRIPDSVELIDGGLEEMEVDDEYLTLYTAYEDFGNMVKMLEQKGIEVESAELQRIPNTLRQVDNETIRKVMKIIGILEEDEDVTNVYHDMEIPDDFEEE